MTGNSPSQTAKRLTRKLIQRIPTIRNISRKNCPAGMIRKKSFVRKYSTAVRQRGYTVKKRNGKTYRIYPKASEMMVESKCIKNLGLPGKGPGLFGPLRKGELAKHGYSFRRSNSERHAALKRAIDDYGADGVYHKLNAVTKLFKRTKPKISRRFGEDREWVHRMMRK